jgi:hypothetical protein
MEILSDPFKEYTFQLFTTYYDNMVMHKTRDDEKFSIYMARLQCLLLNEQRFLIAIVPRDHSPPFYQKRLEELRWVSLQIRNLEETYDIQPQSYQMKRTPDFQRRIKVMSRNPEVTTYTVENLPIHVSLLHTRNDEYEYPNEGSLISALETFRTMIQFSSH